MLRFIAFGMVFLEHTSLRIDGSSPWWSVSGIFGVPVFFMLSAFLLTELMLRERKLTGRVHVRSFYVRRILRIWPLYFAALGIGLILVAPFPSLFHESWTDMIWYITFVGNLRTAAHGYLPLGMGPLWSIAVEEQFYLAWPWVVRTLDRKGILLLSIALWLVSQGSVVMLCLWKIPFEPGIWCNTLANLQYFALGAGISAILAGRIPTITRFDRVVLFCEAILLFVIAGFLVSHSLPHYLPYVWSGVLLVAIASALIFFSIFGTTLPTRAAPLVYLGKISFGLYVIHAWVWILAGNVLGMKSFSSPSGILLKYLIAIPSIFGLAFLSYNYFEKPFLKLKSRFEFVKSRAA